MVINIDSNCEREIRNYITYKLRSNTILSLFYSNGSLTPHNSSITDIKVMIIDELKEY